MRNNLELMLIQAAEISSNNITVITGDVPEIFPGVKNNLFRKFIKVAELIFAHISLGHKIRTLKDQDAVVIYSFSTEFLFLTFLFSFYTRNVYLVNNHNVQQAHESQFMNQVLKIYHYLNYKFIVLESASILKDLGYSEAEIQPHISLLHSVVDNSSQVESFTLSESAALDKKKVGIIGEARRGKNFANTLSLLLKVLSKTEFSVIVGTNDFSCFDEIDLQGVNLVDTSTNAAYMSVLSDCDVIVLNYERSKYFYRCSGVLADAIGVQTYVVCPDFPFMSSQINYPAKVGAVYSDEADLENAVRQALDLASNSDKSAFAMHFDERSVVKTAYTLDLAIQKNSFQKT